MKTNGGIPISPCCSVTVPQNAGYDDEVKSHDLASINKGSALHQRPVPLNQTFNYLNQIHVQAGASPQQEYSLFYLSFIGSIIPFFLKWGSLCGSHNIFTDPI